MSIKSTLGRDRHVLDAECKKKEKMNDTEKLNIFSEDNADVKVDEELYFKGSCVDVEPTKVVEPLIPNPVLFAIYTPSEKTLWVSIDGYDAGYLYEYDFNAPEPISAIAILDKNSTPLTAITIM